MDKNFILTKGMHAGKTIAELEITHPSYIEWAKTNAPNLLKGKKVKIEIKEPGPRIEPPEKSNVKSVLQPNLDFLNEKSDK